jgi:hypothetical protein
MPKNYHIFRHEGAVRITQNADLLPDGAVLLRHEIALATARRKGRILAAKEGIVFVPGVSSKVWNVGTPKELYYAAEVSDADRGKDKRLYQPARIVYYDSYAARKAALAADPRLVSIRLHDVIVWCGITFKMLDGECLSEFDATARKDTEE